MLETIIIIIDYSQCLILSHDACSCVDQESDEIPPINFIWQKELYDKETRCFCALSVFQLLISTDIYSINPSFCTDQSTFECEIPNCNNTSKEQSKQCIVRTSEQIGMNGTLSVVIFSELSCEAIRDYRMDICDVIYDTSTTS